MGSGTNQIEYLKNMKDSIFLIGFMGTGKSAVASYISSRLGWDCVDTDELIIREESGMSIKDIFSHYGETHFRDIESKVLLDLRNRTDLKGQTDLRNRRDLKDPINLKGRGHLIVSCGGGIVLRDENIRIMKEQGVVILLTATPETIYERVNSSTERPLLNKNMSVQAIAEIISEREDRYLKAADLIVLTDGKSVPKIAEEIIGMLNLRKNRNA